MSEKNRDGLRNGPLGESCIHLCVDMQNFFAEGTDWAAPWLKRVLPTVERIAQAHPERTIFTRFIPAEHPGQGVGTWRSYYERWSNMTLEALPPDAVKLVPSLGRLVPPAEVLDKTVYSPWVGTDLHERLRARRADALIITGTETDVCVLGAVLGAVDLGYRVVVPTDAICSSSDTTHDALLTLYRERYGGQVETASTDEILDAWA